MNHNKEAKSLLFGTDQKSTKEVDRQKALPNKKSSLNGWWSLSPEGFFYALRRLREHWAMFRTASARRCVESQTKNEYGLGV